MPDTFEPTATSPYVRLAARAVARFEDDSMHHMTHSLQGGNEGCPTCAVVAARIAKWEAENPDQGCDCGCECCDA